MDNGIVLPIHTHLAVERVGDKVSVNWNDKTDRWYHDEVDKVDADCPPEELDAEEPLFILYTSGSTGTPKGVMHTTGGYLTYVSYTHKMIFDYHDGDVYWCTADIGWVTSHSYIVYGPLCNGATSNFLPKTRSGKIMRRILKKVAAGDFSKEAMGDTSTLADPTTVDMAIEGAKAIQTSN